MKRKEFIAGETWRIGDLEYVLEGCAPFGRKPEPNGDNFAGGIS